MHCYDQSMASIHAPWPRFRLADLRQQNYAAHDCTFYPLNHSMTLMDARELFCIRIRHAIRAASGGAAIAAIGLTTSLTAGCLTSVLFFVSTIAGTPENFQAFQLRSTSHTFLGACLGAFSYAAVHAIAGTSKIGTFFTAIPFITVFAALRPDPSLLPIPPVSNVVLGLLTISRSGQSRTTIPRTLAFTLLDAALACLLAILVNLPFPDRASDLGRRILAVELRQLGIHISRVASKTFGPARGHPKSKTETVLPLDESLHDNAREAGLLDEDYILPTKALPSQFSPTPVGLERTESMINSAQRSLAFLQELRPFGWTRISDYTSLTRAGQLLMVSKYEPRFLPASSVRWRHATAWSQIVKALTALVTRVSSLESVSCTGGPNSRARFSKSSLLNLFGEAYLPLWVSHYAGCATACAAMSLAMENATCKDMFYLPGEEQRGVRGSCPLSATIDPRKWRARRAEMYYGFLLRCRASIRNNEKPLSHTRSVCDMRALESDYARCQNLKHDSFHTPSKKVKTPLKKECENNRKEKGRLQKGSLVEKQALSFFGVASHSLSEEIGHVQSAMVELAASSKTHRYLSQFAFLTTGFPAIWKRVNKIMRQDVFEWEVRFMLSHSLLLITILALSLFLPLSFEASEIAWVFTSAALAAQLSAEPTLFIGVIRVFATITGAALAFGFTTILDVIGRSTHPGIQYLMIPYIFLVTLVSLLVAPPSFRYAGFLVIVTNGVLLFCPRSIPECMEVLKNQSDECFPNWQYAIARSVNVSIGVAFAVFFHLGFWPRFANEEAFRSLSIAFINAARLLGRVRRTYFSYGLVRSEWLREDTQDVVGSGDESISIEQSSANEGDLYRKDVVMLSALRDDLSSHVTSAMLTVQAEAGVWRAGPLRLSPLLTPVLSEFIALDVSITELATLLGRRPIFSGVYGRSAHEHFVDPLLPYYETIQVSLNNLVGITHRIFEDKRDKFLRENSLDLYQAIAHLTRMRSELRREAEERAKLFEQRDFVTLQVRKRLSSWGGMHDLVHAEVETEEIATGGLTDRRGRRKCSIDDVGNVPRPSNDLTVDDIVLYNTFSFIADGCLSAFVRIAIMVLTHSESKLKRIKERQKPKTD